MSGQTEEREHSTYSPSQIERIELCPGSVALLQRTPARSESSYAEEGTKAHHVLETALKLRMRRAFEAHKVSDIKDETFSGEFYFAIQVALDHVYSLLDEYPDAILYVENKIFVPSNVAPGEADGYCDIVIFIPSLREVHVIDYKHGAGVVKSAIENKQTLQYGAGVIWSDFPLVFPESVDRVVLTIVQPRAFHKEGYIREYETTPYRLYEYIDEMDEIITRSQAPDAPLIPGEEQCRFCDANITCPAREAKALKAVNSQFANIRQVAAPNMPDVEGLDLERLGYIMNAKPFLQSWLSKVEERVYELNMSGVTVPGTKLVQGDARREWFAPEEGDKDKIPQQLAVLTGEPVEAFYEKKLVTLTTAEAMVKEAFKKRVGKGKKKIAAEEAAIAFAPFTLKKPSDKLTLVLEDDPRPAHNRAQTAFAALAPGIVPPPPLHITKDTEQ